MLRATPEELSLLSRVERWNFRLAELFMGPLKPLSRFWNATMVKLLVTVCGWRRLFAHGVERLDSLGPDARVILVSNHRSFFDFYVISWVLWRRTNLPQRVFFPVRSAFFYDHWLGAAVNMAMSGMSMFPPIVRERRKLAWNRFSVARTMAELQVPGTCMGIHPEGTRNKGDPYTLLKAHRGVGRFILQGEDVSVVPIFAVGMSSNLPYEAWLNLTQPKRHPIDLCFGAPIDFEDLRAQGTGSRIQQLATDRVMAHINDLAQAQRAFRAEAQAAQVAEA